VAERAAHHIAPTRAYRKLDPPAQRSALTYTTQRGASPNRPKLPPAWPRQNSPEGRRRHASLVTHRASVYVRAPSPGTTSLPMGRPPAESLTLASLRGRARTATQAPRRTVRVARPNAPRRPSESVTDHRATAHARRSPPNGTRRSLSLVTCSARPARASLSHCISCTLLCRPRHQLHCMPKRGRARRRASVERAQSGACDGHTRRHAARRRRSPPRALLALRRSTASYGVARRLPLTRVRSSLSLCLARFSLLGLCPCISAQTVSAPTGPSVRLSAPAYPILTEGSQHMRAPTPDTPQPPLCTRGASARVAPSAMSLG